jgi:hypothetical protein
MRLRPIGPGIGGLNYAPLLREAKTFDRRSDQATDVRPPQPANRASRHVRRLWQALAGLAQRAIARLVEARMAEARRYVELTAAQYGLDGQPVDPSTTARRYY